MEKIIIQVEPMFNDYYHAARSFQTRKRYYWVGLGASSVTTLFVFLIAVLGLWIDELRFGLYLVPIFLFLWFWILYPFWSGWSVVRSASKKENLTLPAKYELDDEKVVIANQIAEGKYDWSIFDKAFDDEKYFFLSYSTNKNMFQFIPKRAFASAEQERMTRDLIVRHLGEIEDTQEGFTGWKLAVLTAVLAFLFMLCVIVVTAFATIVLG